MLRTRSGCFACLVAVVLLVASACGGDEPVRPDPEPPEPPEPTIAAPNVAVPRGVQLTKEGSELAIGVTASAIYQADKSRVSVVDVTVSSIRRGSIARDFTTFDLPDKVRTQTPYYVRVRVSNVGPGQLGGASVPVYALDSAATYFPATSLLGTLPACQGGPLPEPFAPKETQTRCLLFLVKEGARLQELQLRPYRGYDPVSWTLPERVEPATPEADEPERPRRPGSGKNRS
ncbi:MAG: hypothetical protein M3419_05830 [Actinomycetota bacterium]|nr:hypothetical protein [Actinomycetota bacterium]